MIDPYRIRKDFPMFENHIKMQGHDLVFLDNASTTFKPFAVIKAEEEYLTRFTSNTHRGDYDLCFANDSKVAEARHVVGHFINALDNEIVFTSGTTMSINFIALGYAAKYLTKDDEILLTVAEHASNILPWYKVSEMTGCKIGFIPLTKEGRLTAENLKKVISNKTKIVAVAQVTNVLGFVNDIKEIAKVAHEYGALLACDGAQSVPHMKVDVKDLDVDFLSFSGHKLCGPTGIGVLYGKYELLEKMDPVLSGGGNNVKFETDVSVKYLPAPAKLEAGTLNIQGIYGLVAAIKYLEEIGMENIEDLEKNNRKYAISLLKQIPDLVIYNENAESGIITFNMKGVFAQDLATYLNSKGIACRSGQHCAKLLHHFTGELATVRMSMYFYTTKEDIDALSNALKNGGNFLDAYFA
ncbi:MAG: aminotransferase class V-fold PLP-dependent enzyme [Bacilli bacterium]|nr:aminotransferase class V-fold PLP-dependent enzyme [Bacilli bacterium]